MPGLALVHVSAAVVRFGLACDDYARGSVAELVWDLAVAVEELRGALAVLDETLVEQLTATRAEAAGGRR